MDKHSYSQYPISHGGYGDVFRATLTNGATVAIKTIRIYDSHGSLEGRYAKACNILPNCPHFMMFPYI